MRNSRRLSKGLQRNEGFECSHVTIVLFPEYYIIMVVHSPLNPSTVSSRILRCCCYVLLPSSTVAFWDLLCHLAPPALDPVK